MKLFNAPILVLMAVCANAIPVDPQRGVNALQDKRAATTNKPPTTAKPITTTAKPTTTSTPVPPKSSQTVTTSSRSTSSAATMSAVPASSASSSRASGTSAATTSAASASAVSNRPASSVVSNGSSQLAQSSQGSSVAPISAASSSPASSSQPAQSSQGSSVPAISATSLSAEPSSEPAEASQASSVSAASAEPSSEPAEASQASSVPAVSAAPSASALSCPYKGVPADSPKAAKPMTLEEVKASLIEAKKLRDDKEAPKRRGLQARAIKNHPSAKKSITLYHGTSEDAAKAILAGGVKSIRLDEQAGEFTAEGFSGFYMTDDPVAAAQYIKALKEEVNPIAVLEFKWTPPDATKVKELDDQTNEDEELLMDFQGQNMFPTLGLNVPFKSGDFDMISGPHIGRILRPQVMTQNMWQYAITRKEGFAGLKVVDYKVYTKCEIPEGELPYLEGFRDV